MSNEPANFEDLKKLLALKRREQPPPGYFNRFSRGIRARVASGEDASPPEGWWQRWFGVGELKPGLVGVYALGLTGVVLVGLKVSLEVNEENSLRPVTEQSLPGSHQATHLNSAFSHSSDALQQPVTLLYASNASPPSSEVFSGGSLQPTSVIYRPGSVK